MAQLYANENFPFPSVEVLEELGHDVLTMLEAGQAGTRMSDEDVLNYSRQERRALVTLNRRHFIKLHRSNSDHYGIIVCTYDPDFDALAHRIHESLNVGEPLKGKLIKINRPV